MSFSVAAISPNISKNVTVLASRGFSDQPTEEQISDLNEEFQRTLKVPFVLLTTTSEFVESLIKDMPQNKPILYYLHSRLGGPSTEQPSQLELQLQTVAAKSY